jgi:hypothetical protein
MTIRAVRAGSMRTDKRTDRHDEANSIFFLILQTHLKISANLVQEYEGWIFGLTSSDDGYWRIKNNQ